MNRKQEIEKARKVDTEVARLWSLYHDVQDEMSPILKRLYSYQDSYNRYVRLDLQIRAAQTQKNIDTVQAQLAELREKAAPLKAAAIAYDKEHYEGWTRFFLVKHIHISQHCSSFRLTTRVGWLPAVSGLTEVEAVAEYGATLCTICFPSAPVELTQPKADPNVCEGSGQPYSREDKTGREHSYYGKAGYCPVCLRWQTVTASGVMRKHKPNDETKRHALDKH